jgi:tetratricopeptide (TPR) repeat protein
MPARVLGFALLVPLACTSGGFAGGENWAGKTVILKDRKVRIGFKTETGGTKHVTELTTIQYTVLDDRDGLLKVRESGKSAWFPKDRAVLADDAVEYFTELIAEKPGVADYYKRRAAAFHLLDDLDAAVKDLDEAIRLDPKDDAFWNNRAMVVFKQGDVERALSDLAEAIRLKPSAVSFYNRAGIRSALSQYDQAVADYDAAIRLKPDYANAFVYRGVAYFHKKEYRRALSDYDEAIRCDPEEPAAYNNKADDLACCPDAKLRDGARAVELAKTACRITKWKVALYYGTLAACYAETGQFQEAVKWQKKALEDPEYERNYGDQGRARLECYEADKPYRYPG